MIFPYFPERSRNDVLQISLYERSLEMEGKQQTVNVSSLQSHRFNVFYFQAENAMCCVDLMQVTFKKSHFCFTLCQHVWPLQFKLHQLCV